MSTYVTQVLIDWDNNGYLNANSDVSAYFLDGSIKLGMRDVIKSPVADVGSVSMRLNNNSKLFSPPNAAGALFNKLKQGKPVTIKCTVGGSQYTRFVGYIKRIAPRSGISRSRDVVVECQDVLGLLQQYKLDFPLQLNKTGDAMVAGIVSTVLGAPVNTLTVTFAGTPTVGHTLILTLPNGTTTITYAASAPGAGQMLASSAAQGAASLIALINQTDTTGTLYGTTQISGDVSAASGGGNTVVITSRVSGNMACAAFAVASNDSNVTLTNAGVGTGGVDWPVGFMAYDTGINVFPVAGTNWNSEQTTALSAITQITLSENGRFYQQPNGTLTWKNRNFQFLNLVNTLVNSVTGEPDIIGDVNATTTYNIVKTIARPHSTLSVGVVGQITAPVSVPGNGSTAVRLPFVDPTSQQKMGASNLVLPLVKTTDWVANTAKDGSGIDYTTVNPGNVTFTYAINASGIEVTVTNTASGTLWLTKFQVRGVGLVTYNPVTTTVKDTLANLQANGANTLAVNFDLSEDINYSIAAGQYLFSRYSVPAYRASSLDYGAIPGAGGSPNVPAVSLNIDNRINVSDTQLGINTGKYEVIGMGYTIKPQEWDTVLNVSAMDDQTYWILGDSTYGVLGTTTRLAI